MKALRCSAELPNDSSGSDGALNLADYWIRDCIANHGDCRVNGSNDVATFVPTRLLDVSDNKLRLVNSASTISDDSDRRYVALSHCWGKIHIIRTLKENVALHSSHVDFEELSKTFKEAVLATRKLGFRFIWIDSLCIIQDDDEDWAAEAKTMCDVYQYATLTISAAHAPGGDIGCFKERDGLLQIPFVVDVAQRSESNTPAHIVFTSYGRNEGLSGPEPPLYGRAWVLQEQLLSPRNLVFDGSQLRWECLTTHASERSHLGGMSRHGGHAKRIQKAIRKDVEFFSDAELDDPEFAARAQHLNWCYAVMDYTHRGMTQPRDRLIALAGIAQALSHRTTSQYLAGLWTRFFWAGLLWSIPHTREYTPTTTDAFDLASNKQIRHLVPIAPSWSWASVTAPIVYLSPTLTILDCACSIQHASTSPIAAVQTGRVEIRGHVRKGYINPVYSFAIQEAASRGRRHMMLEKPEGQKNLITFKGRAFAPNDYFLFSLQRPKKSRVFSDMHPQAYMTRAHDWRFVRGTFRPDEVISCTKEITFLAVAQQHAGHKPPSLLKTHEEEDPLAVYTLALLPVKKDGVETSEYRRVGYAVWSDCAWYGYNCGQTKQAGSGIEKPGKWTPEEGWTVNDGVFDTLDWWLRWGDLEFYKREKGRAHEHGYLADALPDLKAYHHGVGVEERMVVIV